jgi:hypothetical protein
MTIDDRIDLGNALRIMDKTKPAPMATCPTCHDPLVMTFEFPGAEFICVPCDRLYGFLSPLAAESTPELEARHEELKAEYLAARAARQGS